MTDTMVDHETMTLAGAVNRALAEAMELDPKVILLGEDIADPAGGVMKATAGLSTRFGVDRVRATPIAEQAIIGAAIGASLGGYRPVAEVMLMDFFAVCMDQMANHAATLRYMSGGRTNVPITIRTAVGGGRQFSAQHSQSLEAWMMHPDPVRGRTGAGSLPQQPDHRRRHPEDGLAADGLGANQYPPRRPGYGRGLHPTVARGQRRARRRGQPLYLLETDKVEMEVPAPISGVLSISVQVGGPYEVGTEIGIIETV